jgi:hypothetical protein
LQGVNKETREIIFIDKKNKDEKIKLFKEKRKFIASYNSRQKGRYSEFCSYLVET